VKPDDTLINAADLLIKKGLKTLPVVDDDHKLVGIITRLNLIYSALQGRVLE